MADKKQDEKDRQGQGAGRPGGSAAPGADERDDKGAADTGAPPRQTPPADEPDGGGVLGPPR